MKRAATRSHTALPSRGRCLVAVASRDVRFDCAFVYAVRSTGIYCRPSCPAKRPRADQIVIFAVPDAAESAGFRACRRCHPRQPRGAAESQLIARVCREIASGTEQAANLRGLALSVGLSPSHLQRTFRRATGITPRQYADALRLARLKSDLRRKPTVTIALYEAGYGSSGRLYETSDAQLGMTPSAYRRGGHGMRISYSIAPCALGRVLVAGTERGVSAVYLGDRDATLVAALRKEYPLADIEAGPGARTEWLRAIIRHLDAAQPELDLPTDVIATTFQRRVWQALRRIPYGETRTYGEIARELGRPSATRAVARACATNPAAIVVPCHRVIRTDGSLAGYRWGLQRKKKLLEIEKSRKMPGTIPVASRA